MDEDEKEAIDKAKKMSDLTTKLAESAANSFEEWLANNQNATKEDAHKRLVRTIDGNAMMVLLMLNVMH